MLPPENRLTKVRDFNLLLKSGRWIKGQFLDMRYSWLEKVPSNILPKRMTKQEFISQLKIVFTVGIKIDKRAVVRNRIKRQMREVVRLLIKEGKLKSGYYILLVARKDILNKKYEEIKIEIEGLLKLGRIF